MSGAREQPLVHDEAAARALYADEFVARLKAVFFAPGFKVWIVRSNLDHPVAI
jgi:hypothetical protein